MKYLRFTILALIAGVSPAAGDPLMNQVQFIGTHNSYHIAPSPKIRNLIETFAKGEGDAINHTHKPLREQLEKNTLTPDIVRGSSATLREAVTRRGWPRLAEAAGKFMFALDNGGAIRDRYLALSPDQDLRGRLLFVDVPPDHPAAAWMKRNNPAGSFNEIRRLVAAGFMVRTRADEGLREVRAKDLRRFEQAVTSGAQWISTDAPEELPGLPGYQVSWKNGNVWQKNPVVPADSK